jgi:hypothetical protein
LTREAAHTGWSFAITTTILMIVGLVAGLLPALKASRLDPVEALQYEEVASGVLSTKGGRHPSKHDDGSHQL